MHDPLSDEERDYIDDQAYGHNKNAGRIVVTGVQKARGCDGDVADQGERNDAHDPLLGYLSGNVGFDFLPGFVFGLDRAYRIADDGHEVAAGPLRGLEDFRKVAHVVDMGAAPKVQEQAFDGDVQAGLQDNVAEFRDNEKNFLDYYDDIEICEQSAKAHYKSAMQIRNRAMVDRSDLVICCIQHKNGGAYKTVQYAKKHNKDIINVV